MAKPNNQSFMLPLLKFLGSITSCVPIRVCSDPIGAER